MVVRTLGVMMVVSAAAAAAPCLPANLGAEDGPKLDLGLVNTVPTVCATNGGGKGGVAACWKLDADGSMIDAPAVALPGRHISAPADAKGCFAGFCTTPAGKPDDVAMVATSTDGAHTAVAFGDAFYVFDAKTKKQLRRIPLMDEKATDNVNVSNMPMRMFYAGDRIFIVGTDAGPYIAVWGFKDDGARTGVITDSKDKTEAAGFNVFIGFASLLDDKRLLLADAGFQRALTVTIADGKVTSSKRKVSIKPCKQADIEAIGEGGEPKKACAKVLDQKVVPYADASVVALANGNYLALLGGKALGSVAVLDSKTFAEKNRIKLARCKP